MKEWMNIPKEHQKNKNGLYFCPSSLCKDLHSFKNIVSLVRHIYVDHQQKRYNCDFCRDLLKLRLEYKSHGALQNHLRRNHRFTDHDFKLVRCVISASGCDSVCKRGEHSMYAGMIDTYEELVDRTMENGFSDILLSPRELGGYEINEKFVVGGMANVEKLAEIGENQRKLWFEKKKNPSLIKQKIKKRKYGFSAFEKGMGIKSNGKRRSRSKSKPREMIRLPSKITAVKFNPMQNDGSKKQDNGIFSTIIPMINNLPVKESLNDKNLEFRTFLKSMEMNSTQIPILSDFSFETNDAFSPDFLQLNFPSPMISVPNLNDILEQKTSEIFSNGSNLSTPINLRQNKWQAKRIIVEPTLLSDAVLKDLNSITKKSHKKMKKKRDRRSRSKSINPQLSKHHKHRSKFRSTKLKKKKRRKRSKSMVRIKSKNSLPFVGTECELCGKILKSIQGLGVHLSRTHGYVRKSNKIKERRALLKKAQAIEDLRFANIEKCEQNVNESESQGRDPWLPKNYYDEKKSNSVDNKNTSLEQQIISTVPSSSDVNGEQKKISNKDKHSSIVQHLGIHARNSRGLPKLQLYFDTEMDSNLQQIFPYGPLSFPYLRLQVRNMSPDVRKKDILNWKCRKSGISKFFKGSVLHIIP